jgi:hypothetical protein
MDLLEEIGVRLDRLGEIGVLLDELLDVVGVVLGVDGDLRGDAVERLAAIRSAAACTPASIHRNRLSRM